MRWSDFRVKLSRLEAVADRWDAKLFANYVLSRFFMQKFEETADLTKSTQIER